MLNGRQVCNLKQNNNSRNQYNIMKKLVLTIVSAFAVTGIAFAQGDINWSSISPSAMTAQTNSFLYSPLFGGGTANGPGTGAAGVTGSATTSGLSYYYELLYNTSFTGSQVAGASSPSNSFATLFGGTWLDAGRGGTNSSTAGRLTPINSGTSLTVPWAAGVTNNIILVGWSANLGTSWGTVSNELATGSYIGILQGLGQNGFFGVSAAGFIAPNSADPGVTVFATAAGPQGLPINSLLTPLYLLPVPEPTTIALAGLSGLSLLMFRRR